MWDRMDNPMDSYMCPLYPKCPLYPECPSYPTVPCGIGWTILWTPICVHSTLSVHPISYSPIWNRMDHPMDSYMCPLYTKCPSYPTVPCGIGWTILWTPIYVHSTQPNPKCPSYTTVPCGIGWTILWTPMCPLYTTQS